ncbi:unnamed protein product [Rhizophagus irregularis]|uniref:Uncharacterized protein n=1 Tax=Rhizophagus irregularis TaxID=588596 RepID=A0A2I1FF18_9GLOM|nr:hypothetical protein RhiirB3_451570 [Rhizophagus irregularis]CAB5389664.1 unnamed protein product [Rhizophagus irregularis]
MVTHNSSNNFGDNIYESNSQTTVAQTYDTYMPVMPVTYCNNVNNVNSDQQLMMSKTISPNQQTNVSSPNHNQRYQQHNVALLNQQQYDAINNVTISPGRQPIMSNNNVTISPDQQTNVSSPNHNQRYQQHNVASLNQQQYDAINNVTISPGRQSTISNNNVTISPDQQPIPNQQYQQHNVVSPNHQQQYETAISDNTDSFIPGLNHHHNYQQPSDNSNNTNHNNNQQSSSNNDSPPQFSSPQSAIFPLSLNITINSPQTNFIIIPNSDIQQVLSFLNNPSSRFQR